jgi:hypothetical protein
MGGDCGNMTTSFRIRNLVIYTVNALSMRDEGIKTPLIAYKQGDQQAAVRPRLKPKMLIKEKLLWRSRLR